MSLRNFDASKYPKWLFPIKTKTEGQILLEEFEREEIDLRLLEMAAKFAKTVKDGQ